VRAIVVRDPIQQPLWKGLREMDLMDLADLMEQKHLFRVPSNLSLVAVL